MLVCECLLFLGLTLSIQLAFIHNSWPTSYIETVEEDYMKGPIVDLQFKTPQEGCNEASMGSPALPGTFYEVVGQSYLWGLDQGCYCPHGSQERWGEYTTTGYCNSTTEWNCYDISSSSAKFYNVVNGKVLCSRNEMALNLTNLPKPNKLGGLWDCTSGYKLCGSQQEDNKRQLTCVPERYMCPLNKIEFVNGQMQTYTDHADGSPLVDIRLSQGGPPCIDFKTDLNSITNKQYLYLYPYDYDNGCEPWPIGGEVFYESTFHEHVPGWEGTNELTILQENENGVSSWGYQKLMGKLNIYASHGRYNFETLRNYKYEMYSRSYLDWTCRGPREDFVHETTYMNEGLNRMKVMRVLCYFQVGVVIAEMIIWCLAQNPRNDCLTDNKGIVILMCTRLVAFGLCIWMFVLFLLNMLADNKPENLPVIQEVHRDQCAGDDVLNAVAGSMLAYTEKNFSMSTICFLIALIGLFFIVIGAYIGAKDGIEVDEFEGGKAKRQSKTFDYASI